MGFPLAPLKSKKQASASLIIFIVSQPPALRFTPFFTGVKLDNSLQRKAEFNLFSFENSKSGGLGKQTGERTCSHRKQ